MRLFSASLIAVLSCLTMSASHIIIADSITSSEIYPGTVHTFEISVPDTYRSDRPAALLLGLDGQLCNAPAVIDSLMADGSMPVTIGVFLQPGIIRDPSGTVVRYNRSNEFDATDSRFARFLATELLPAVESKICPDGRAINFTANPSDRAIYGLSSGGIAAFTAAWHRPDLFGKVFSGCGTFVPMRGGHSIQAIVRKHEPLPLRIFLQDGFDDCWNPTFGSWFDANATLGSALRFAGYDLATDWAEGNHSVRRATEIFPQVLRWLWRDGSNELAAKPTSNELLASLLTDAGDWEKSVAPKRGMKKMPRKHTAVPAAFYPDSSLMAQAAEGTNYVSQFIIAHDGKPSFGQPFYWLHTYDNSVLTITDMAFDGLGQLWVVTNAGIQICDQNGRVRGILRLPSDLELSNTTIEILPGLVMIVGYDNEGNHSAWQRRLNTVPAEPGVRPASQGQA